MLEVDIILGQTENSMKYLEIGSLNKDNNKDKKKKDLRKSSSIKFLDKSKKKVTVQTLNDEPTELTGDTNKLKIKAIERDMQKYFKYFKEQKE